MAQTKEIRKKIGSVQNTKKITSAMELVASSKMKKTQDAMKRGKPYSVKIVELIDNLSKASSEYKHPFFKTPEVKSDVYIIVGTDKGLCGGLNTNLFKLALNQMAKNQKSGREVKLVLFGKKAADTFSRLKNVEAHCVILYSYRYLYKGTYVYTETVYSYYPKWKLTYSYWTSLNPYKYL